MSKQPSMMPHKIFKPLFIKLGTYAAVGSLVLVDLAHAQASGLVPCDGEDCTINSVMQLINKIMDFFFHTLLFPLFVVMVMYLGFSYLKAGGSPGQHAKLGSMAQHMVLGLLLMLCAWLIVKTILSILGYNDPLGFFG
jgi:hypothetical protein